MVWWWLWWWWSLAPDQSLGYRAVVVAVVMVPPPSTTDDWPLPIAVSRSVAPARALRGWRARRSACGHEPSPPPDQPSSLA
uniref:Putative secreted protein n=1 Tax=Anopheles triannulatus TaxID=58253 RepID=A0A2M4B521_9DIPT